MQFHFRRTALAAAVALSIGASITPARANDFDGDADDVVAFTQTNLNSNLQGTATFTNANLTNAWGLAFAPGGAFWINGNHSGTSNLLNGDGSTVTGLVVTIPPPGGSPAGTLSSPTGIVANATMAFQLPGTTAAAAFIFATEDGTISAWNPTVDRTNAKIVADNSAKGAEYKGLASGVTVKGPRIYATNFRQGTVDVFDGTFTQVTVDGGFVDKNIRNGFAPFGIQNIDGDIWVTYAKQDAEKEDDVGGAGNGFVDVFDTDGHLLRRFTDHGVLNSPWGLARAPFGFGQFAGDILIGNQQDGRINAFDSNGNFRGSLRRANGQPIKIDKLWALEFGGGSLSSPESLYFTAGPDDENNGLFGVINAVELRHRF